MDNKLLNYFSKTMPPSEEKNLNFIISFFKNKYFLFCRVSNKFLILQSLMNSIKFKIDFNEYTQQNTF